MKSKKKKIKKVSEEFFVIKRDLYPYDIVVTTTADDVKLFKFINKKFSYFLDEHEMIHLKMVNQDGKCVRLRCGHLVVRLLKQKKLNLGIDIGVLAHELLHAALFIFSQIGIKLDENNNSDEALTYYFHHILEKTLIFFQNNPQNKLRPPAR